MSANCLFLALDEEAWRQLRSDPEKHLDVPSSSLLFESNQAGEHVFRGLELQEDVVDALQLLLGEAEDAFPLEPTVPFVRPFASARPIQDAVGQPTPLDGFAWYLPPDEVRHAAHGLERISVKELASRYSPEQLEESGLGRVAEDLDHLEPWTEQDLPVLRNAYAALVGYFQQAAGRQHGMLVFLEDGPVSSLDLEMG